MRNFLKRNVPFAFARQRSEFCAYVLKNMHEKATLKGQKDFPFSRIKAVLRLIIPQINVGLIRAKTEKFV